MPVNMKRIYREYCSYTAGLKKTHKRKWNQHNCKKK